MGDSPKETVSAQNEEIMRATYRALRTHGYADLTIKRIADEYGKSTAAIHREALLRVHRLEDLPTVSPFMMLFGGGIGILVGSWTSAPRMIKSISQEYASLGPRRSISTLVPSFLIAQTAVLLGVPVSFNEIIVSAIIGSGAAVAGGDGVSPRKLGYTVAAWIGSFVLAFGLGYGSMLLLEL